MASANRRYIVRAVPTIYARFDSRKRVFRQVPVDGGALETFDRAEAEKRYGRKNVLYIEGKPDEWGRSRRAEAVTRRFWLAGEPVAQARARTGRGHAYYPKPSADYRKWAALQLRTQNAGQPAISGPVKVGLLFYRVRPKSNKSEWPTVKPDLDNYVKMILDALMDAGILRDDSQVCRLDAGKMWTNNGPGVEVVLEAL